MFGTGGDEINENCYQKDPNTQEDLKRAGASFEQALDSFTQSTHGALRDLGKKVVVWQGRFHSVVLILVLTILHVDCRDGTGSPHLSCKRYYRHVKLLLSLLSIWKESANEILY